MKPKDLLKTKYEPLKKKEKRKRRRRRWKSPTLSLAKTTSNRKKVLRTDNMLSHSQYLSVLTSCTCGVGGSKFSSFLDIDIYILSVLN